MAIQQSGLKENIACHCDGCMTDDSVIIPQLRFSFQIQMMLHHFEKDLDIPSLAIDANDFISAQISPGESQNNIVRQTQ